MAQLQDLADRASARRRAAFWSFIIVMIALAAVFVLLGVWQLERLAEKEAQIALVTARAENPPVPFPFVEQWSHVSPMDLDFQPVVLTGMFRHAEAVLVFTSLANARGEHSGIGYWVLTPFEMEGGGLVFVNRGFVPEEGAERFLNDPAGPQGKVTVIGIARRPEATGSFTPEANGERRIDWIRDPQRLALLAGLSDEPVSALYVDQAASAPGQSPQGGETILTFPNRHLEYAMTWFAFALLTPLMLAVWIYRQRQPAPQSNLP